METILIADDHPVSLNGIIQYVSSLGYEVIGQFTNGITAYNNILALKPDYAILDISMPGMNGLEVLEKIRHKSKSQKVILYTMFDDMALFNRAKSLDVNGYVLKDFALEELKECLSYLKYKKQWFTPRLSEVLVQGKDFTDTDKLNSLSAAEKKILSLVGLQKSSKDIAEQLFITEKTVENHRGNIIKKLELAGGKNTLLMWAVKNAERL